MSDTYIPGGYSRHLTRSAPIRGSRTDRRGASAFEGTVLLALVVLLILGVLATAGRTQPELPRTTTVRAQSGDTLWGLAESHPVAGMSTAQTADAIGRASGIDSGAVRPGTTVVVPAQDARKGSVAFRE